MRGFREEDKHSAEGKDSLIALHLSDRGTVVVGGLREMLKKTDAYYK